MIDNETGEVITPFLRSAYNYDVDAVSRETGLLCADPTLAQQQFAEEANINTIVERFGLTGELPTNVRVPVSGDFTDITDYQTALNMVLDAEAAFMELPANVRARFENDPQKLQDFVEDASNLDEARRLGIAVPAPVPAPEPAPTRVIVVEPSADSPK